MNMKSVTHYLHKRCTIDYLCFVYVGDGVRYKPKSVIPNKKIWEKVR
jgi:hypothetical protein